MSDRRSFLLAAAGLVAGGALAGCRQKGVQPLFRISLAQWSLHRALFAGALDPFDFPRVARETYGIDAVEYVSTFYKDTISDPATTTTLAKRAGDHGVRSLLIMVDGEGALGDPDPGARRTAVENHRKWLAAAKGLGCHSIRVNARSSGTRDEQRERAADGLRALTEHGAALDLNVIVENHGGLSSDGSWLASVIRRVDHPRCGTLPDFGNFRVDEETMYDRYLGVREMMPFAKAVSAKSNDFDEAGDERHTDYRKMMKIVLDAGYRGWVGVEYEGSGVDEPTGIRATKALLERVRDELGERYAASR